MDAAQPMVSLPQRSPLPFTGVSLRKRSAFYVQFARMRQAGIAPVRTLQTLAGQGGSRRLARAAAAMADRVEAGGRVSDALAQQPNIFPANEVRMIEGAEFAGRDPETMLHIARLLDRIALARGKVVAGMIYPVGCLLAAFVGLPLVIAYVLGGWPAAWPILRGQLGAAATVFAVGLGIVTLFRAIPNQSGLKVTVHALALGVPLFGKLFRRLARARFADVFQSLYGAGVMVPEAMARAALACGNQFIGGRLLQGVPPVAEGGSVATALAQSRVIPQIGVNLVEVGEQAGKLEDALQKFAEYEHQDLEIGIERLSKILPMAALFLMIIILACAVLSAWGAYIGGIQSFMGQ